ncbi:YdeI/OmpD-associated family protein [Asticcacaulis sp. AC460]|uniref:YdeI/OmpD-associated family protein n=1 Tax=Asticcacaulis sp. AC460 TaxID=1282360 RepID=UPI0004CE0B6D|nr:YdeI/OmpD-associated family protein [Asticcacaulis sp. AC460]
MTHLAFETPDHLYEWLRANHATATELWVRMYKKASGTPSVNWEDCVVTALAWGWIDGVRRPLDEVSFIQRLSPRRAKSSWSQKNRDHVDRLIAEGRMQPSGLEHVEAAKADGRWDAAYAPASQMVLPEDFLDRLRENPPAQTYFDTLSRSAIFTIYFRLHSAKRPETRAKRLDDILERLSRGETWT